MTLLTTGEQAVASAFDVIPSHPSLLGYFREAIRIVRLDDEAMARVSRDPKALKYAAGVFGFPLLATFILAPLLSPLPADGPQVSWVAMLILAPILVVIQLCASAISVAVLHYLAKFAFGATGSYLGLLRVLWLGSVVLCLAIIPVVGVLVACGWFLLITLITFENVDGIERLQALALIAGFAVVSLLIRVALS